MTIHQYLMKARQDDARRAGERVRLLLGGTASPRGTPPASRSRRPGKAPGPAAIPQGDPGAARPPALA